MAYYTFRDPESGEDHGSFETFYVPRYAGGARDPGPSVEQYPTIYPSAGWYWWPCSPGCLPDGDPVGPFDTERDAVLDANQG